MRTTEKRADPSASRAVILSHFARIDGSSRHPLIGTRFAARRRRGVGGIVFLDSTITAIWQAPLLARKGVVAITASID